MRAAEWDWDVGEPEGSCAPKPGAPGVWERKWSKAQVEWSCLTGHGIITTTEEDGE